MAQRTLFSRPSGPKVSKPIKRRPKVQLDREILELINRRQRQILVHSNLYYRQNVNLITDAQYDRWSHQLYDLIQDHPEEFRKSVWYEAFRTFDGNTGMGLPYTDPWVEGTANHLLKISGGQPT